MPFLTSKTPSDPEAPKNFKYEAVSPTGTRMKATMTAPSAGAVAAALHAQGWIPVKVEYAPNTGLNFDVARWAKNRPLKLPLERIAQFAAQLRQLLDSGVSIPQALASLGEEEEPRFSAMCVDLSEKSAAGVPLWRALEAYPAIFDEVFVSYIRAGEDTGSLPQTVKRLTDMLDKRVKLAKQIRAVTSYPKFVSIAITLIVTGIMLWMVPMFANLYKQFGAKLPLPTRILVSASHVFVPFHFLKTFGINMLGVHFGVPMPELSILHHSLPIPPIPIPNPESPLVWLVVGFFGARYFLKRTKNNRNISIKVDKLKYRMPLFGDLIYKMDMYRWATTLAGSLDAGVPAIPSLELAARASGSRWQQVIVEDLQEVVRTGRLLSEALNMHRDLFPPAVRSMVATGERAGEVADMLKSVANAMDDDIERIIHGLSAKIEVALIMVMGAVVGAILVALYLPIIQLTLVVAHGTAGKGTAFGS